MCDPATRPSFIASPGGAQMTIMYTLSTGDIAENVLHLHHKDGTAWSASQLTSAGSAIATSWATNVAPQTRSDVTLQNIRVTDLSSNTGPSILETFGSGGTKTGSDLPAGVTLALKLSTAMRGRSYRGRIYFVGLANVMASQDKVDTTYANAIVNAWRAVMADINAITNVELAVLSYCNNKAWRPNGVLTPVTSIDLVDTNVDYQRRRSTGHAVHR